MIEAPDYFEPIEAWRLWCLAETPAGVRLASLFHEAEWPPRQALRAKCLARRMRLLRRRKPALRHRAPDRGCSCGVYGARQAVTLLDHLDTHPGRYVAGRVLLWGFVVECERGWRGELAYPAHLYIATDERTEEIATALQVYGVPVEARNGKISERLHAVA